MAVTHALWTLALSSLPWQPLHSQAEASSDAAAQTDKPDVVLITVDALRADRLGVYGYDGGTSPRLDAFAAQSLVFERAYTTMPSTSFALTSLMVGYSTYALALESNLDAYPTLADRFHRRGYETIALYPPAVHFSAPPAFDGIRARHFGFAHATCDALAEDRDAILRTDAAIDLLEQHRDGPVFMWVHYFAPHEPYVDHAGDGLPAGASRTESERYDGEIRWVDGEIGRLLDFIEAERPNAIVILTADHGEEFGERGGAYHGTSLFDEQIRVPLVIHVPAVPARREPHPVSTADVPSMIDHLLATEPNRQLSTTPLATSKPVFAELGTVKAVVSGQHKAICDLWAERCRLYDLASDPKEEHDLAPSQPRMLQHLRRLIGDHVASAPGTSRARSGLPDFIESGLRRARRGDRSANASLLSIVADKRAGVDVRIEAAKFLSSTSKVTERKRLERLWPNENPTIHRWLAAALARIGDSRARAWLLHMSLPALMNDVEFLARRAVVLAIPNDPFAVSRISEALDTTTSDALRCQLMAALGYAGTREAGQLLTSAYDDVRTRYCVVEALSQLSDPAVAEFALAKLGEEPYSHVRALLVRAVARAKNAALRDAMVRLQSTEREPIVSAAVAAALSELTAETSAEM